MSRLTRWVPALLLLTVTACVGPLRRPAWERPPPSVPDAPVVQEGALRRSELSNGLRVLVLEDRRLPRVVLGLTVRVGEGAVETERAGLTPFVAELMTRGAGDRDALALAEAVDRIGATLDVGAGWDSITVSVTGLSRDLERLMEILSDVALRPRLRESEARKARSEILASLERAKDDPATLGRWHLMRALYGEHRYGTPSAGTAETVPRLSVQAARELWGRVFLPNVSVLSASGDVDADDFLILAGRWFGAWDPGEPPDVGPAPPVRVPEARRIVIVDRPDLVQARILIAHEGLARTDPDRIPASLMNAVLGGGGFSSRLMVVLRSDHGLTYGVGSGFSLRRHPGPFYVSTSTRVAEVRRVIDLTLAELERVREEPPTDDELRDARAETVGRFSLGLETSEAVMASLVDLDVYGLPENSLDTFRGRVRATDTDDTERMAREHVHPERTAIVLVGPASELLPQVEDLGPVEVVLP